LVTSFDLYAESFEIEPSEFQIKRTKMLLPEKYPRARTKSSNDRLTTQLDHCSSVVREA
jgi:hypothetical protein